MPFCIVLNLMDYILLGVQVHSAKFNIDCCTLPTDIVSLMSLKVNWNVFTSYDEKSKKLLGTVTVTYINVESKVTLKGQVGEVLKHDIKVVELLPH